MIEKKIPRATAKRLPIYYRYLKLLLNEGNSKISSVNLSKIIKIDAATIRRDFSCFGALGKRGYGYDVAELLEFFANELNQNNLASVALIGLGNLGHALLNFKFQKTSNVRVSAVFDVKSDLINTIQNGVPVFSIDELEEQIDEQRIDVAMLAVPTSEAQIIATRLENSGIKGILNFTPMRLNISQKVHVQNVDLTNELQTLLYFIDNNISN